MKKRLLSVLLLFIPLCAFSLPISVGMLVGTNMNSPYGKYALNTSVYSDYKILEHMRVGLQFEYSNDFANSFVLSPSVYGILDIGRFEVFAVEIMPYAKINMGASIISSNNQVKPFFLSAATGGVRIYLQKWFIDPQLSIGFPYTWSASVGFGYSFE